MHIHYLQHVDFEGLASINKWANTNNHNITVTKLFENEPLPPVDDFDLLFVMGGPMNVYEESRYPWLLKEKKFIGKAIDRDKFVAGICLGAQLIADVLGALVFKNAYKEIGWFDVNLMDYGKESVLFNDFKETFKVFQWHGDAFELPCASKRIATSEACQNQAFQYSDRVFAFQFHLEFDEQSINALINNCADEIINGKYVQSPYEMQSGFKYITGTNNLMFNFLDKLQNAFNG